MIPGRVTGHAKAQNCFTFGMNDFTTLNQGNRE